MDPGADGEAGFLREFLAQTCARERGPADLFIYLFIYLYIYVYIYMAAPSNSGRKKKALAKNAPNNLVQICTKFFGTLVGVNKKH